MFHIITVMETFVSYQVRHTSNIIQIKWKYFLPLEKTYILLTKVNGGLMTGAPAPAPADCGQSMHLQATHLEKVFLTN